MGEGEGGESSWGRSKSCRAHEKSFIQLSFRKTYVVFAYISNPFFPSSAPTLSDRWWSCSTGEPTSSFNRPRVFNTFARILSSRFLFSSSLLSSPLHEEPRIQLGLKKERRVESSIVEISISINAKEQFSRFNPSFPLSRSSSDYHLFPTGFQEARHSSGNY